MNHEFETSTTARSVFAAAAVVITASIGGFIDHLATGYPTAPRASVQSVAPQVAAIGARS